MTAPAEAIVLGLLELILRVLGPAVVRQRIDEWEAAQAASDAAFAAKFPGEEPPP